MQSFLIADAMAIVMRDDDYARFNIVLSDGIVVFD